jgi:hypothetical protein
MGMKGVDLFIWLRKGYSGGQHKMQGVTYWYDSVE